MIRVRGMLSILILICASFAAGCSDADRASPSAYGDEHLVELYSGGRKVREWQATGKVFSEENSDGFYFKDAGTGQLVRVTGDVVVTPLIKNSTSTKTEQPKQTGYDGIPPNVDAGQAIKGDPDPFKEVEGESSL